MRATRRKDPDAQCKLCRVRLESRFGAQRRKGGQRRSYCDDCAERAKRITNRIYVRNYYRRKHGLKPDPISEKNITAN